jgi:bifunctional non-homologous end joining protein LigD
VKIKYNHRDVFQVVGYTDGEGTRSGLFGALILAQNVDGELLYGGKVGTGFTFQSARKLADLMDPLVVDESPIAPKDRPRALKHISSRRPIHWIRPELRAVVEYNDTSHDGIPLHPSFKGLDT